MTYTALEWPTIDVVAVHLADGHSGVLVGVHLDEGKAPVGLEPRLDDKTKVLEQGDHIARSRVRREVADVASRLPVERLSQNDFVTSHAVCRELMVTERGGRSHAHRLHSLLLRNGRLTLLVGPVATDGARTQPLAIHAAQCLLRLTTVTECDEPVSAGSARLHIPHDTCF